MTDQIKTIGIFVGDDRQRRIAKMRWLVSTSCPSSFTSHGCACETCTDTLRNLATVTGLGKVRCEPSGKVIIGI